jgi:hypothetical protein
MSKVYDGSALPTSKSDKTSVPGGQDPTKYLSAADWNLVRSFIQDLRDALNSGGEHYDLASNPSASVSAAAHARLRSNVGRLEVSEGAGVFRGLLLGYFNPVDYGADPTGAADSTAGFNACIAAAIAAKGIVGVPQGFYKITDTILAGGHFVDLEDCADDAGFTTTADAPSYDGTDRNAAAAMHPVSIVGFGRVVLWWGGSAPSSETPILEWSLPGQGDLVGNVGEAVIQGITFAGPASYNSSGVLQNPSTGTAPTTNVTGLFIPGGRVTVRNCTFRECHRGLVMASAYWSRVEQCVARHVVGGFDLLQFNAGVADGLAADYASIAITASGQGVQLKALHTEECGVDIYVPSCDQLSLDGTYFEAVGAGLTDYSLKLGDGTNDVLFMSISNSHLSRLHGKTCHMQKAQVNAFNTRWYDHGTDGDRLLLEDSSCVLTTLGTPIPINTASWANNPTIQAVNWMRKGISFTFQDGVPAGESVTRTYSDVTGARVGDPVIAAMDVLPSGWNISAQVTATDTVKVVATNATGGSADLGTMTGFLQVQQNKYLGV